MGFVGVWTRMSARVGGLLCLAIHLFFAAPGLAASHDVAFGGGVGNRYDPSALRMPVGDGVVFKGNFSDHPLYDGGDTPQQTSGTTDFSRAFNSSGTFVFYCQKHGTATGGMRTVVTVSDNQLPTVSVDGPATIASGETANFTATASDPDGALTKYEWDLDGNGSFETVDDSTASRVYTGGQTVSVKVRVTDDNAEAGIGPESATAARTLTVSAPPGSGGATGDPPATGDPGTTQPGGGQTGSGAGGGGAAGGLSDTTAPRLTLSTSARRPLRVVLTSDERATAVLRLRKGRSVMAKATVALTKGTRRTVNLRLSAAARRLLRAAGQVRGTLNVTVKDAAGNATTRTRSVTLRA